MVRTDKHDKIMEAIKNHCQHTGGGLPFVKLISVTGFTFEEIKPLLRELYEGLEFHVREGLNDKLFFYGSKKKR